jgi:hypothetical protein
MRELGLRRPQTEDIVDLVFGPDEDGPDLRLRPLIPAANAGTREEGSPR